MEIKKLALHTKILIGLILGVVFGLIGHSLGWGGFVVAYIKPVGDAFIRLLKMIVVPLVFASLLIGTASLTDLRKLGRMAGKTIGYYLCTTAIAITLGLVISNIFQPGQSFDESRKSNLTIQYQNEVSGRIERAKEAPSAVQTLLQIIPDNPINAMSQAEMLQIIFFAMILGVSLTMLPQEKSKPVIKVIDGINQAMMKMVLIIMKIAPYGVFALIAAVISQFGYSVLADLLKYSFVVLLAMFLHATLVYSFALKFISRYPLMKFFKGIRKAQIFAFSTSSSNATLPVTMDVCEKELGVSKETASFVLPLGATINMDGTAIFQGVAAFFIAQVIGLDLTIGDQLTIVLTATLASIGTAGVPGVGVIMLIMVLQSIGLSEAQIGMGIALILGVDRILDMCRTVVNITGDCSCAVFVNSTEKKYQLDKIPEQIVAEAQV